MTEPVIVPCIHLEDAQATPNMSMGGFDLHGLIYKGPAGVGVICPISQPIVQNVPTGEMLPPAPMFSLTHRAAQTIFDALYKAGLRPSSGEATEAHRGELAATRAHLNDMRALAFHGIELAASNVPLKLDLDNMVI